MILKLPIKHYAIIGSYAMGTRPAADIDVVCYEKDVQIEYERKDDYCGSFMFNGRRIELLFADKQYSLQSILCTSMKSFIADNLVLFIIKAGHITYPHRSWEKHIADYHVLKASLPVGAMRNLKPLIERHKKSTEERLGAQRLPKLVNVTKDQFFDDKVVKYYVHDDIHQWFAHKASPMYTYMQPDPALVYCDKKLWNTFSEEEKIQCVMEECYVIASERHLIPAIVNNGIIPHPEMAFKWALMRVCTTLCSGWFRQYAIDHYFDVLNNYNKDYLKLLKSKMNESPLRTNNTES